MPVTEPHTRLASLEKVCEKLSGPVDVPTPDGEDQPVILPRFTEGEPRLGPVAVQLPKLGQNFRREHKSPP
ncbi:hypothetical protein GCM10009736_81430 [Actinomadura bangladeshensis]